MIDLFALSKEIWIIMHPVLTITGPLFLPQTDKNGKEYVTYQVTGENKIAVPTHFFKTIFYIVDKKNGIWPGETIPFLTATAAPEFYSTLGDDSKIYVEAYIIPNAEISMNTPLESFKTSIHNLEKQSGIIFPEDLREYFRKALVLHIPPAP